MAGESWGSALITLPSGVSLLERFRRRCEYTGFTSLNLETFEIYSIALSHILRGVFLIVFFVLVTLTPPTSTLIVWSKLSPFSSWISGLGVMPICFANWDSLRLRARMREEAAIWEGRYLRNCSSLYINLQSLLAMSLICAVSVSSLWSPRMSWYLSRKGTEDTKWRENSRALIIFSSSWMRACLVTKRRWVSARRRIMMLKEGCIGYSSLAAMRRQVTPSVTKQGAFYPSTAKFTRYLSAMLTARKSVSIL